MNLWKLLGFSLILYLVGVLSGFTAFEGRVSNLFLQENAEYRGRFDAVRQMVKHAAEGGDQEVDLLNAAVVQTFAHGGFAATLPASAMPNGVPVCATFRYPL